MRYIFRKATLESRIVIFENPDELSARIEELTGRRVRGRVRVFEDASSYMAICGGSVLRLAGNDYYVRGDAREERFGIEDQPKFWVKRTTDLTTGEPKIIKLVFHEQFTTTVGPITVRCRRSPEKESAFLDRVRGDPRFMQGVTVTDPAGNLIRILDTVRGKSFFNHVAALDLSHERYFHEVLPDLMRDLITCVDAMAEVHRSGLHHGDIRNDHIIIESGTGRPVWIDFDYEVNFLDYDIWSMGNVVNYAVGKGIHSFWEVNKHPERFPRLAGRLDEQDALTFYPYRIASLPKLYPYIPDGLGRVLRRYSAGSADFYADLEELSRDLRGLYGT